jgi:TetR/AcrR family transcriptional regulator, tetracycline repressor protein
VVERALQLADADGVDAVTMRRLGRELGVEAMALYTHVRSKADLLSAIGSRILTELEFETREPSDWRGRIETVCRAWAALRERHPHSFTLIYRADTGVVPVTEELMDALLTAGFAGADAWLAYQTLVFFLDAPLIHWPRAASPGDVWRLDSEGAHLRELAPYAREFSWDDVWENGLELFLDGLEARLGR